MTHRHLRDLFRRAQGSLSSIQPFAGALGHRGSPRCGAQPPWTEHRPMFSSGALSDRTWQHRWPSQLQRSLFGDDLGRLGAYSGAVTENDVHFAVRVDRSGRVYRFAVQGSDSDGPAWLGPVDPRQFRSSTLTARGHVHAYSPFLACVISLRSYTSTKSGSGVVTFPSTRRPLDSAAARGCGPVIVASVSASGVEPACVVSGAWQL